MQKEYLSDPMYTFENANHASKACGPLVLWAIAQVKLYRYLMLILFPSIYIHVYIQYLTRIPKMYIL